VPRIAIISPNKDGFSESFIREHIEKLSFEKFIFYGGFIPTEFRNNRIYNPSLLKLALSKLPFVKLRFDFEINAVINLFKKLKIDLVFTEYGQTGAKMMKICQRLNIPLIVHFHGYDAYQKDVLEEYRDKYRELFKYASRIIAVSHDMEKQLQTLGSPQNKILYNPCGPNDSFYKIMPDFHSDQLLSVGRFVNKKAPFLTILAFKKALESCPNLKLMMVGDGYLLDICKMMSKALNLEASLTFAGAINHDQIHDFFAKSFCFIQHSVVTAANDSEGTPVGILEASAAGLPVISTRHAGIPDVVIHEKTGLLVQEFDINAMAASIVHVATSRKQAQQMGSNGRTLILAHFSLERHISKLNQVIQEALQTKKCS
jgi:colanic acid/amylovoran biosynthesis glycosyltransferase